MLLWKDIEGYEGLYQISSYGVVRSCPRKVTSRWGKEYIRPRTILGRIIDKSGYYRINLRKDGKNRKFYIHRLTAIHFIDNPNGKKRLRHKNGILTDNRYINLEWS